MKQKKKKKSATPEKLPHKSKKKPTNRTKKEIMEFPTQSEVKTSKKLAKTLQSAKAATSNFFSTLGKVKKFAVKLNLEDITQVRLIGVNFF